MKTLIGLLLAMLLGCEGSAFGDQVGTLPYPDRAPQLLLVRLPNDVPCAVLTSIEGVALDCDWEAGDFVKSLVPAEAPGGLTPVSR